jgi:hypothetical protein
MRTAPSESRNEVCLTNHGGSHRPLVDGALLIACGQSAPLFEAVDAPLHDVTTFVDRLVESQGATGPERTPRPLIAPCAGSLRLRLVRRLRRSGLQSSSTRTYVNCDFVARWMMLCKIKRSRCSRPGARSAPLRLN